MDIADKAQELQEIQINSSLTHHKSIQVQATEDCIECGNQISLERQIATGGTDTCIKCKEKLEHQQACYAGPCNC
jgi:RNA polymerase-binding transcription factor DksA